MKYEYFLVLFTVLIFPLIRSFSKELNFYNPLKRIVLAILLPFVIFVAIDVLMVSLNTWWFNESYITEIFLFTLPVEEILFFIVIPFSSLFLWESLKYLANRKAK